jgi:malate dehydrogenase (oxaloacetate-decarboxylating)(NADP+)
VLGFPFIFRGALDVHATAINEEMKMAAVRALAELAKKDVPDEVAQAYGVDHFKFGKEYLIPKPFDHRILESEASAVAQAAIDTGVAQRQLDMDEYRRELRNRIGRGRVIMSVITDKARRDPKRVVFPEGASGRILRASSILKQEGIATPILLGHSDEIQAVADEHEVDISGIQIIDPIHSEKRHDYAEALYELRKRKGITREKALLHMRQNTYYGLMMLEKGDCDAVLSGVQSDYATTIRPALQIIKLRDGISTVSGLFALIKKDRVVMFADTTVNVDPSAEILAEIAQCSANVARAFNIEPKIAFLSFSNFGSARYPESDKMAEAVRLLKEAAPDLEVDGEMQGSTALLPSIREKFFEFSELKGEANVLIFPNLSAGSISYQLVKTLGDMTAVGPILMGLSKPVHVLHRSLDVNEIVDMAAIAVVDAQR